MPGAGDCDRGRPPGGPAEPPPGQRGRPGLAQALEQEGNGLLKPGAWGQDPGFATCCLGTLGQWFTLLQPRLLVCPLNVMSWLLSL